MTAIIHVSGNVSPSHFFWCPGCDMAHEIESKWSFNGDLEVPTISPSVLVSSQTVCHSFITDGQIQFLSDSTHALAGQTVNLPAWPFEEKL